MVIIYIEKWDYIVWKFHPFKHLQTSLPTHIHIHLQGHRRKAEAFGTQQGRNDHVAARA